MLRGIRKPSTYYFYRPKCQNEKKNLIWWINLLTLSEADGKKNCEVSDKSEK